MEVLDVFKGDGFSVASMTKSINTAEYKPQRLGEMKLFEEEGITTTVVQIEESHQTLTLVPTAPRGGVADPNPDEGRNLRSFSVPHIPTDDAVLADAVQNIRASGGLATTHALTTGCARSLSMSDEPTMAWMRV